jgi:hypothetical protein
MLSIGAYEKQMAWLMALSTDKIASINHFLQGVSGGDAARLSWRRGSSEA